MDVVVVDAEGDAPRSEQLTLAEGTTLAEALRISRLAAMVDPFGERKIGIFGQLCLPEQVLEEGDRIEIYRPLLVDPKDARRRRAEVRGKKKPGPATS